VNERLILGTIHKWNIFGEAWRAKIRETIKSITNEKRLQQSTR